MKTTDFIRGILTKNQYKGSEGLILKALKSANVPLKSKKKSINIDYLTKGMAGKSSLHYPEKELG